jgi:O-antigen/teichoic acid export membrane protein
MASIFRLAMPIGVGSLFVMLNMRADVFLLARMASDTAVGLYSAAFRFYDLAALVAVILATPILPIFATKAAVDRSGLRTVYRRLNDLLGVVLFPVAVLTPVFSETVMTLAFGEPFRASARVLDVLAWVSILTFYAQLGSAANLAVGDVTHAYWNGALAATINIGLNLAWIPKYGYMGSAWATLAGDAALVGVSQAYVFRNLGVVFRRGPWLRIVAANAVLWVIARSGFVPAPAAVQVGLGLLAYVLLVVGLGLFSRDDLALLPGWPTRAAARGYGEPPQR